MSLRVLLITPPFTQLNTPYPATMYLKGYLNTKGIWSRQADLGIEVIHQLFSKEVLTEVFRIVGSQVDTLDDNLQRIYTLRETYLDTISMVMSFLSHKQLTLAHQICSRSFLPEASRFEHANMLDDMFGELGIIDKAKYLATMYLEDLGDLITTCVDPYFGFNKYGASIASAASSFDPLCDAVMAPNSIISDLTIITLESHLKAANPDLVCITVPFPGNLFGALKCAQYIKQQYPHVKTCMGGGYVNTELRTVTDERFFEWIDYVSLDDGEAPLSALLDYMDNNRSSSELKRMFIKEHGVVQYKNGAAEKDIAQRDTGTPDYSDLYLDRYLSILEVTNPMHRLWSDGRWNKLTLAHGCYWGKCSFCDISLDYIARYEPITPAILCDRMQAIIDQTGEHGFHFVDEAAPPALMGDLAMEIIRRRMVVTWWTNIRFEKSFTPGLCRLLSASGCIAVSGGLEVASDRLLAKMKKGVTIEQVSQVTQAFTDAGIMVHAYLMYGFPTQTDQETIDSLEIVRQMFEAGILQSGFWHRFAMTSHSPVGIDPAAFDVVKTGPIFEGFADNDNYHSDPLGGDHDAYNDGLKTSLFNYMNSAGFDLPLSTWFEHETLPTSHPPDLITEYLSKEANQLRNNAKVIYLGYTPTIKTIAPNQMAELSITTKKDEYLFEIDVTEAQWLVSYLPTIMLTPHNIVQSLMTMGESYQNATGYDFQEFMASEIWELLEECGMVTY